MAKKSETEFCKQAFEIARSRGDVVGGLIAAEKYVRTAAQEFGGTSNESGSAWSCLADVYCALRQYDFALKAFVKMLIAAEVNWGEDDPRVILPLSGMAHCCLELKDLEAARDILKSACNMSEKHRLPPENKFNQKLIRLIADYHKAKGDTKSAKAAQKYMIQNL